MELATYKNALTEAMFKGTKRNVESEDDSKRLNRVNENELFTRLLYYGTVHLNRTEEETWLTPIGLLMDLWECHKQFLECPNQNGRFTSMTLFLMVFDLSKERRR